MIKTLRESKAKLSELVEMAGKGQEILITVRGKVKARLTPVESGRPSDKGSVWAGELRALHKTYGARTHKARSEDVLTPIREDRL
jgi:prevent-host-death family protein